MKLKGVIVIVRLPFLILALILGILGASLAWYEHQVYGDVAFNLGYAFIAGFGLISAHASVNIWNDFFDARSKLDYRITRTPFSGGSGAIPGGLLTQRQAMWLGIITAAIASAVGIFFCIVSGWLLLPLIAVAGIIVLIYTPFILKTPYPEWSAGLGLGVLPVIGAYFVQTGVYHATALIASIPSGLLVHNLLLFNEFSDAEADKTVKRRTLPIIAGKKFAAIFYSVFNLFTYLWIIAWVIAGQMPVWSLLALLTLPFAFRAIKGAFQYDDLKKLIPAQGINVLVVLLTQLFMAIGFIVAGAMK